MALINKDNQQNAAVCEVIYPDERVIKENSYDKMFISCPSVSSDVFTIQIDKSTKINIE